MSSQDPGSQPSSPGPPSTTQVCPEDTPSHASPGSKGAWITAAWTCKVFIIQDTLRAQEEVLSEARGKPPPDQVSLPSCARWWPSGSHTCEPQSLPLHLSEVASFAPSNRICGAPFCGSPLSMRSKMGRALSKPPMMLHVHPA